MGIVTDIMNLVKTLKQALADGKVVILAQQIQKGLGFVTDGVSLKNV